MGISSKAVLRAGVISAALSIAPAFAATNFVQTKLIADVEGVANVTDKNLVGTWGISVSAASPFWVSNAGNGTSTVYTASDANQPTLANPTVSATVVTIPPSAANSSGTTGIPTGQVANGY